MHYTRCSSVNAYTSATEKLVDWEKAKLSTCYPTDLHIINKNNIIFSKDIKTRSRNTFRLSNNKFYQYNTPLSYCSACDVLQLLRSKHCKVCQRCVRTFDHHCPWINNCVAENNRCFFLLFLYIEEGTIFFSLKYISNVVYNMLYYDNWYFFCWLLMLLLTLSFFFFMILSLGIYHSYLCLVSKQIESKIRTAAMNQHYFGQMPFINETTWENGSPGKIPYLKNFSKKYNSPFFLSYSKNVLVYFCYFPLPLLFLQKLRDSLLSYFMRKEIVVFGKRGEILWKSRKKLTYRSSNILFKTLETFSLFTINLSIEKKKKNHSNS
ncbi:palmitoyltransferase DHHC6 [Plasmodium brasilianum]|uniref:Palmitoyltransferase DHHC6 n=1 Tax=Plasmodium brasilianum TaxID=5824 RepID=A0ACB9YDN1_PLABR|nr:palmitoyltransferase DHHC6 [Plasmodium brasilianum]